MIFTLKPDRKALYQMLAQCPDGHIVEIRKPSRSLEQNALYWSTVHEIAESVEIDGKRYTPQVWHKYFKERFLPGKLVELPGGHLMEMEASTTDLSVEQFSDFVEQVLQFKESHT